MTSPLPHFTGAQHTARTLALQVLLDCRRSMPRRAFVQEVLDDRLAHTPLSAADRRLATQLVYGVLRRRDTLHALIEAVLTRPAKNVEAWLWDALSLGALQLALLTQIPPHAALNETVELAAQFGRPGAKGFSNGVLRALSKLLSDTRTTSPGADALPLANGEYRQLTHPVLPDPNRRPADYLAAGFALPGWLVKRWLERYGPEECYRLGFWFAAPPPLTLRCNPLRVQRGAFLRACAEAGLSADAGSHPQAVRLHDGVPIRDLPGYEQGWFTVQDESGLGVSSALAPEPGSRVLDLCAAPGGKTTHLAELMANQGEIVACDIDEERLQTVTTLANRLGLSIIRTCLVQPENEASIPAGPFDAALVDVPCSNTGVLGRRPEVRWRLKPGDLRELVTVQTRLLRLAVERVRPGGCVVYSTCSIEPEENRQVVESVLRMRADLDLEAEQAAVPGQPADGGYWARLRRA
jgi:16S rRNA (cytosine967-C5)-methyltransferase